MHFCTDGIDIGPLSALLRQPGGVQVGDGARLDLEGLSLDVVAGDLLRLCLRPHKWSTLVGGCLSLSATSLHYV